MCGIAGFTRLNRMVHKGVAYRITQGLTHRGPDQQGIFEGSDATLCAVRLKIIDLDGGDQPFVSEDGDTAIAFNGEVYNHREIRVELERLGHRFRSHCDTETVLHAFLEWDTECFRRMRGMFAVALWTESRKRLLLVRDRMGIKPLYYYPAGQRRLLRKRVEGDPGAPGGAAPAGLDGARFLSGGQLCAGSAHLNGRHPEGAGGMLAGMAARQRHSIGRWWAPPSGDTRRISVEGAKEELDALLRDSVREHLVSDVPLGVWASGGLDSSAVLHYAAQETAERLKTFSVSFAGRSFDETPYFREIAKIYGTDHHEFDLNPEVELAERDSGLRLLLG